MFGGCADKKPPFREGIEYKYEWEASIALESGLSDQQSSSTLLRGQLYIVTSKAEDESAHHWGALIRVYMLWMTKHMFSSIT